MVGIDYRVANGLLYGVGDAGGVYTLDDSTAETSKVGQLSVSLQGTNFGVDVNPAADALRVVGDQGHNLRFSFAAGTTTVDGTLTYPPATMPVAGVSAAAYTNNDLDPNTATTLFDLDTSLDQIAIQAPANSGQLSATGKLTIEGDGAVPSARHRHPCGPGSPTFVSTNSTPSIVQVITAPADLTDPHPDAHRHEFLLGGPHLSVVGDLAHQRLEQLSDQC